MRFKVHDTVAIYDPGPFPLTLTSDGFIQAPLTFGNAIFESVHIL